MSLSQAVVGQGVEHRVFVKFVNGHPVEKVVPANTPGSLIHYAFIRDDVAQVVDNVVWLTSLTPAVCLDGHNLLPCTATGRVVT